MATYGELASYIPELTKVDLQQNSNCHWGFEGNILALGNGLDVASAFNQLSNHFSISTHLSKDYS